MKKTWQQKLEDKAGYPKVLKLEKRFPCYNAAHKMGAEIGDDIVLVNPSEVTSEMQKVPEGRLTTVADICKRIAARHDVAACCSLTAGIFVSTAANAVEEDAGQGKNLDIPYWRTLKSDGFLNEKFPGGVESHRVLLEREGFTVTGKGKRLYVEDYQNYLVRDC